MAIQAGRFFSLCFSRPVILSVLLSVFLISAEGIYFLLIFSSNPEIEKSDLIAVFPGGAERTEAGFRLAASGLADHMAVHNREVPKLDKQYKKSIGRPPEVIFHSGKSTSSFEDALATLKIARDHNFSSIILVTSAYHMPRSYFLLRVLSLKSKIKIQRSSVERKSALKPGHLPLKDIFNEMVKFWGSIVEVLYHRLTGSLLSEVAAVENILDILKKLFLFEKAQSRYEIGKMEK